MHYSTILVHVDLSRHAPARIGLAAELARAQGAQLVGAAMTGVSPTVLARVDDLRPGTLAAGYFDPLAENARRALAQFERLAAGAGLPFATRLLCDTADAGLVNQGRFADLVVISQDDPDEAMPDMATRLPESVILGAALPVLVAPRSPRPPASPQRILLAWDGGREAARAMHAALPLLSRAEAVHVASFTRSGHPDAAALGHEELAAYLARNGVAPRFHAGSAEDAGQSLLALADELGCGLLVMGCYGHSRFHELCLGGASRVVLAEARLPVLMAH
jgi:nucleotide-binding universal stress UspA family protein